MKSMVFYKSIRENIYFTDIKQKNIALCHPLFLDANFKENFTCENNNLEADYYKSKFKYLKKMGFFNDYEKINDGRITPSQIEYELTNTKQLLFEVTDACNLKCKYCGYGEFYGDYDVRSNAFLSPSMVESIFSYMEKLWRGPLNASQDEIVSIGFYGGEPLLNMDLIKMVVAYVKKSTIPKRFVFTMTTNAMLLHKYMDFLVENEFHVLISLDGDENNNNYRIDKQGNNIFSRLIANIDQLSQNYPEYFEKNVQFNAVLHNMNSVSDIYSYINNRYGKIPRIGELNTTGIIPEKKADFEKTYRNISESLNQAENYSDLESNMFMNLPSYSSVNRFLHLFSGYVFKTYVDLLFQRDDIKYTPTGTCHPFSRKIFITVSGKILPCERIGQQYALGTITANEIFIDFEWIANRYNSYLDKINSQCADCERGILCVQCIFNLDDLDENAICKGFMRKEELANHFSANISFLEEHSEDYYKLMEIVKMQ